MGKVCKGSPTADFLAVFVKKALILLLCGIALSATGCLHPKLGPQSLPRDRALYSTGLADSWKEQMLLNIVKLRYVDAPTFIDVGSIVSSYTLSETATAAGTIVPGTSGSNAAIGIGGTFSSSPTITFTPLTGSKFIQGLLTPLPPTAVFNAIQNGSPAHLILLSTVISINGLKNQQATLDGIKPADPEFDRVRELMRKIQLSGGVRLYVKPEGNKEPASILALRRTDIDPETLADIRELRHLLKLNPDAEEFTLVQAPVSSSDTEIAILTRSIISLMQNMAAQVEVPAEDLAKNHAFPGYEKIGDIPDTDRMIRIRSGKQKSTDAFVAVNYRNTWFWIDDGDLRSKLAFLQLMNLFTMADTAPRENQPVVTIPAR
jgi:hypothetical protein